MSLGDRIHKKLATFSAELVLGYTRSGTEQIVVIAKQRPFKEIVDAIVPHVSKPILLGARVEPETIVAEMMVEAKSWLKLIDAVAAKMGCKVIETEKEFIREKE